MAERKQSNYPAKVQEPERKCRGVRQQAFEQLIERQTCERFEEWMGQKAS